MPAVAAATSKVAYRYQRIARLLAFAGLVLVVVYAFGGPGKQLQVYVQIAGVRANVAGLVATVAFALASVLHLYRTVNRPERKWYGSRGLTEEIKSFAWRYAMGSVPFAEAGLSQVDAEERFGSTLHVFLRQARKERLSLPLPKDATNTLAYVTPWMTQLRSSLVEERRTVYAAQRILNQQDFYRVRSRKFDQLANWWNYSLIAVEAGFAALAALQAVKLISLDFYGVAGTLVAAGVSWVQFNQYRSLADLYADMAFELGEFHRRCMHLAQTWTDEELSTFVDTVESFLEAEHATWRKLVDPDGASESRQS
jgi:hypothetical protein